MYAKAAYSDADFVVIAAPTNESDSMAVKIDVGDDNPAAAPCGVAGEVVCGIFASLFCVVFLSAGQCAIGNGDSFVPHACIRLFEGIKYVLPILHPNKKRLALIMCPEEDSASVEWARQKGENWVNKDITSLEFVENIFRLMNWNRECRYKVLGRVANSDQGLCMLFDLEEAIMFTPKPQEYADPLTGEMKKKQMKFFPDTYRNRIGKSYNDYIADHQMNMFEDFIGYQGSAVLDEPVREEDSFSKESMSQESEISENILLPDLAKQSESIEQQSGEIAERGMPT